MPRTQLNSRVDQAVAAEAAGQGRATVTRSLAERAEPDREDAGRAFVEAAADFMRRYESVFAEEFGTERVAH
ncbi:antitoxin [Streptomyces sp. NBC_00102]|uniref:antitoxin n=1 Tax=Streptomyces sp. NBC_00102 TaxID=2975652 RepID=UPI002253EE29|nr:antitoxin [Streptomyces sp. NBC_00102]MCX5395445.1 antitoxin [Streptomyces sp. NBC_00102]